MEKMMKAVVLTKPTKGENVTLTDIAVPQVMPGWVLGKVYEWNHFDPIKAIPNGVCLTGFYSNYPTAGTMQDIFNFTDEHRLRPLKGAAYDFENIREACIALDEGKVNGKIVVKVGD